MLPNAYMNEIIASHCTKKKKKSSKTQQNIKTEKKQGDYASLFELLEIISRLYIYISTSTFTPLLKIHLV